MAGMKASVHGSIDPVARYHRNMRPCLELRAARAVVMALLSEIDACMTHGVSIPKDRRELLLECLEPLVAEQQPHAAFLPPDAQARVASARERMQAAVTVWRSNSGTL